MNYSTTNADAEKMNGKTCIIICGPTASGKTAYGIDLALQYDTEIISADSRQCFRQLNIGVAKPNPEQLKKVKHHFIDSHSIHDTVNVKVFEEYALKAAEEIFANHDTAIMVGGTGLYIKAFAEGLDEIPEANEPVRRQILEQYVQNGIEWLQSQLTKEDPLFMEKGETQNPQRMLRALEVIRTSGRSILEYYSDSQKKRNFQVRYILLNKERAELYEAINHRVDVMMQEGLLKEAEALYKFKENNALQTVGYRELFDYLDGKWSLETAVEEIKKNTRHYAKRQNTWFKKYISRD